MKRFSKIKKILVGALMIASVMLFAFGVSACGDGKGKAPELIGFDVGENINVDQYKLVSPKNVHVTDKNGTMYDVVVKVTDSKGNEVYTDEGNKFNAKDAGGYTITYSIDTWTFSVSKSVQVIVNAAEDNLDFEVDCKSLVTVGDTVTVNITENTTNPTYSLSVINMTTGHSVPTSGLSFVPTEVGTHTLRVTVAAVEGTATKEVDIYARGPLQEGEVETFGMDWMTVRSFSPKQFQLEGDWSATDTTETGIKDIDGNSSSYAMLETDREYTHIYFSIRESRAYYRDLAMKGYTHVRFRVYVDSQVNHGKLFTWEHNPSNSWRTTLGSAKSGGWTEFYIPLTAGVANYSDKKPGFVDAYDYYTTSTWILLIDNSDGEWNVNGRDKDNDGNPLTYKVYFDDVMAVRRTYEITENTTLNNDVYDVSAILNRAWGTELKDYKYSITKYTNYDTVQKKLVENQNIPVGTVDLSALPGNTTGAYGSYEIVYKLNNGDPATPYQRMWIDVLDPSQKLYANPDLHNFTTSRGMIWKYPEETASVVANTNGTITYTTRGLWGAGLQIAPAYDKAYYEALKTEGYDSLTFSLKLDVTYASGVPASVKTTEYEICSFTMQGHGIKIKNGETKTITVKLSNIIANYDRLKNVALDSNPNTYSNYVLFFMCYNDSVYNPNSHEKMTFTLSNLHMVTA